MVPLTWHHNNNTFSFFHQRCGCYITTLTSNNALLFRTKHAPFHSFFSLIPSESRIQAVLSRFIVAVMVLESILSSPRFKRHFTKYDLGGWTTLLERHRFLLSALALLAVLCTVYLYFAVTLGANDSCSGLGGSRKASCHMELVKTSVAMGKLKNI